MAFRQRSTRFGIGIAAILTALSEGDCAKGFAVYAFARVAVAGALV